MSFLNIWLNESRLLAINHARHITLKVENTGSQVLDGVGTHEALCEDAVMRSYATGHGRTYDDRFACIKPL